MTTQRNDSDYAAGYEAGYLAAMATAKRVADEKMKPVRAVTDSVGDAYAALSGLCHFVGGVISAFETAGIRELMDWRRANGNKVLP